MPPALVFRGSRAALVRALAAVPAALAGRAPDPVGAARGLQLRLSTALLSQVQQDFVVKSRGGVGRDGVRWAPLKPATLAARARARGKAAAGAGKADVLRDTGRLLRSLTPGVDGVARGPDQVVRTLPGAVVVGTNVPYAEYHQTGTRHLPARPVLPRNGRIPPAYWPAIGLAAARGVARAVVLLLGGRP